LLSHPEGPACYLKITDRLCLFHAGTVTADASQPVTDSVHWSDLDHFDEDVCARVRAALLDDLRVQAFLCGLAEQEPNESLEYWEGLENLEALSDGFLTRDQGHRICDRLRDGGRPRLVDDIPTLWGAFPPASIRGSTHREGRRRWSKDDTIQRGVESIVGRFPDPTTNTPGDGVTDADRIAAKGLTTESAKVARHRLRKHLPGPRDPQELASEPPPRGVLYLLPVEVTGDGLTDEQRADALVEAEARRAAASAEATLYKVAQND
jgi:hypothetical protein